MGTETAAEPRAMRTVPRPTCPLCGEAGPLLHEGLRDRMGDAAGAWGFRACPGEACGILWLDPAPVPEDLPLAYRCYFTHEERPPRPGGPLRALARAAREGYLASRWGVRAGSVGAFKRFLGLLARLHPAWRDELDLRAHHLPAKPGGRLLEVGCGSGDLLLGARDAGWTVRGVDFDAAAVALARRRGLEVHEGDLASAALAAGSFDAVAMIHVLEHVPDPKAVLGEAHRILAPGGRLVLVTPNIESRGRRMFGSAWRELDPPRHLHLFAPGSLRFLVEQAGFEVERLGAGHRDAVGVHAGSRAIAARGRFSMHGPRSAGESIRGHLFLLGSALAGRGRGLVGEETILVARRGEAA